MFILSIFLVWRWQKNLCNASTDITVSVLLKCNLITVMPYTLHWSQDFFKYISYSVSSIQSPVCLSFAHCFLLDLHTFVLNRKTNFIAVKALK